jgi:hypothetical protein
MKDNVLIGSEAVRAGTLTSYQLCTRYRALFPDVYVADYVEPSLRDWTVGAWLWSRRRATIAGLAAAALHGSCWVDDHEPVELIWRNTHPPSNMVVRNERIESDEMTRVAGLPVTTVARTAFDLGRHLPREEALVRLDALTRATPFAIQDVMLLAKRYRSARGTLRLREVLSLVDSGAASPRESWLRLLLVDAGLPAPSTQIPVVDGWTLLALLDMGWEEFKVAAEYDGDQHRTDRRQYVRDIERQRKLERGGWILVRVIAEDRPGEIIERVRRALIRRGWRAPQV